MPNKAKDQIMTRTINSVVGHFVAHCNLDQKHTVIRDPRNDYRPVAFVPSVEKADVLQAIRRVGQKQKLEQSLALLGIQTINDEKEINLDEAQKFKARRAQTPKNKVAVALRASGVLPEEEEISARAQSFAQDDNAKYVEDDGEVWDATEEEEAPAPVRAKTSARQKAPVHAQPKGRQAPVRKAPPAPAKPEARRTKGANPNPGKRHGW